MSYPTVALNLSERNLLYKPKPRYTTSEEDSNFIEESSSTPRHPLPPESHLYPNYRGSYGLLGSPFSYYGNHPIPYYSGSDSISQLSGMDGDPTRLSSSVIPYNFECGSHNLPLRGPLPTVVHGSNCNFHPYYFGQMKIPAHLRGYESFFFSNFRRPKRIRTAFTPTQLLLLETAFEKNHYVVGSERRQLSHELGLSETQVKVWFQNRRTKHKRQKHDGQSCSQKTNDKDCLDCRETSSDDPLTSDDEDETVSSKAASSAEIDVENPLLKCQNSSPALNGTKNLSPALNGTKNLSPALNETQNSSQVVSESHENSVKTVNNTIWSPINLKRNS